MLSWEGLPLLGIVWNWELFLLTVEVSLLGGQLMASLGPALASTRGGWAKGACSHFSPSSTACHLQWLGVNLTYPQHVDHDLHLVKVHGLAT